MNAQILSAEGVGDAPMWLAEEGLKLATIYFEDNMLDPIACYEAQRTNSGSELARHWDKAWLAANKVLLSDPRYNNSMISLFFEEEE